MEFLTFYAICAAISLLGGILLSFYFFRRNCHPVQTLENLFAPEKAPSEELRQTGEIGTIIRQIRDLPEYNVQQESRLKQAILGQALRGRSPRSSRRANRSPTALYWPTTGSVCCCSAAPKGWAGSNTDPGNGSSSGKQLGLFPDRLHEDCSSFDFRGRRPDGGKALPFGAKGVGWCDRLQPAGVFRLQQSARRSAKPCQGGGERFGVRPACRVSQCFLR